MAFLWFGLGVVAGSVITLIVTFIRTSFGVIRIDRSNPNKDMYRIDIGEIDDLHKRKRVILRVDANADLSQK
jgi:hypothetical protein